MQISDLLGDILGDSPEISPILAPISPALARHESPETGHLSPFSPFSPTQTADDKIKALALGRTWEPGNPYICECGHATGWRRDGKPLCPICDKTPAPAGAISTEDDYITRVAVEPGICPLCDGDLNQDGGDCWHRAFHLGAEKAPGAPLRDDQPVPAPTTCENQCGPSCAPKMGREISPVALGWLRENRQALHCNGWRPSELWRRNKSRGIAWAGIWDMPSLSVVIESGGTISFSFVTATGQTIRQTAWPKKYHQKRS